MRKQYHFWPGVKGLDAWDVDRLIRLAADLPIIEFDLTTIAEIDSAYWFDGDRERPTVRRIIDYVRLRFAAQPEPDHRNCHPADLPYD